MRFFRIAATVLLALGAVPAHAGTTINAFSCSAPVASTCRGSLMVSGSWTWRFATEVPHANVEIGFTNGSIAQKVSCVFDASKVGYTCEKYAELPTTPGDVIGISFSIFDGPVTSAPGRWVFEVATAPGVVRSVSYGATVVPSDSAVSSKCTDAITITNCFEAQPGPAEALFTETYTGGAVAQVAGYWRAYNEADVIIGQGLICGRGSFDVPVGTRWLNVDVAHAADARASCGYDDDVHAGAGGILALATPG